jgi:hypothetical protein
VRHGYPAGEFSGSDVPDAWIAGFESFNPALVAGAPGLALLRPIRPIT